MVLAPCIKACPERSRRDGFLPQSSPPGQGEIRVGEQAAESFSAACWGGLSLSHSFGAVENRLHFETPMQLLGRGPDGCLSKTGVEKSVATVGRVFVLRTVFRDLC